MNRNNRMRFLGVFLLLFLISVAAVSAEKQINLLAVEEGALAETGNIASLTLKTVSGNGNVFLDTFPLTKLDTQISLRFSKDSACRFLSDNCKTRDFLYKLRADTSIIGGPSAGAAAAVLTVAEILDLNIDPGTSITGTINSGNFIGPVGGVKAKVEAAKNYGLTKVLVPKGGNNEGLNNISIVDYGKEIGIEVVQVETLEEALVEITDYIILNTDSQLDISNNYLDLMKQVSQDICGRTQELRNEVQEQDAKVHPTVNNSTIQAANAIGDKNFYSAASFCFNANIRLREALYDNLSESKFNETFEMLQKLELKDIDFNSPNNLQVYLILSDRLKELEETLEETALQKSLGNDYVANNLLAFGRERAFSIAAWSKFFNEDENTVKYDLKTSCVARVNEANERLQYAKLFVPTLLLATEDTLNAAHTLLKEERFPECVSKAIEVKVQSNAILTTLGLETSELPELVNRKLEYAKREISTQDYFPILSYSYYEYAQSLRESDPGSALLYAEYSLEMANMDSYLSIVGNGGEQVSSGINEVVGRNSEKIRLIIIGLLFGLVIGTSIAFGKIKKKREDVIMPQKYSQPSKKDKVKKIVKKTKATVKKGKNK
jgi:uncharacterized protein